MRREIMALYENYIQEESYIDPLVEDEYILNELHIKPLPPLDEEINKSNKNGDIKCPKKK